MAATFTEEHRLRCAEILDFIREVEEHTGLVASLPTQEDYRDYGDHSTIKGVGLSVADSGFTVLRVDVSMSEGRKPQVGSLSSASISDLNEFDYGA